MPPTHVPTQRKLSGPEKQQLIDALNHVFPTYDYLEMFLSAEVDLVLANISAPAAMPIVLFKLLQQTEATNKTFKMLYKARQNRPDDPELYRLSQTLGITPATNNLELILQQENILFDIATFRSRIAAVEGQVCRVEINGQAKGTGFLIGPSAVMTNYHVAESVIKGTNTPDQISLRFDHKLLEDGTTINSGKVYQLDSSWLIDYSKYSSVDFEEEPKSGDPAADELDYAILRVAGRPSDDLLGQVPGMGVSRGSIDLSAADSTGFDTNKVLFIPQHPLGAPLKLTTNTFRGLNGNGTRVTYLNDTDHGSSGSPIFNANWKLVGLHHSGDPDYQKPEYNQGIPLPAIRSLLGTRNKLAEIAQ